MKMFSNCSGPCETCRTHFTGGCLAGHGDDDYSYASPEWIAEHQKEIKVEINELSKEPLSVWEAYQGGLAAVVIAANHADAKKLLTGYYGLGWSHAALSRITACTHPMRARVVMIGGKA